MPKLIFLKGLPGSGKSTWAKEQVLQSNGKIKRVNKDELRLMIDAGKWSKKSESLILDIQWHLVEQFLICDYDVIADNTHLHNKHIQVAQELINKLNSIGGKFELEVKFFDTPLEECIRRDAARPNPVGKKVILQMWNQYLKPKAPEYNPDLPDCIICDIDGTLALFEGNPYDRDFSKDELNKVVHHILKSYLKLNNSTVYVLFSGRSGKFRDVTVSWINNNKVEYDMLVMRNEGDNRPDYIVKEEMYREHIEGKYNVKFVIDDRMSVCRKWAELGLFCFCVNQGFVEF